VELHIRLLLFFSAHDATGRLPYALIFAFRSVLYPHHS